MTSPSNDDLSTSPRADTPVNNQPWEHRPLDMRLANELGGAYPVEWHMARGDFLSSDEFYRLAGFVPGEPVPLPAFSSLLHEGDRAQFAKLLASPGIDTAVFEIDIRLTVADGSERWFLARGQRVGVWRLVGAMIDITQRKTMELRLIHHNAALREQDFSFATVADAMPQMVWSTRPDGFHDYYNARWYDFTGVPSGSTDGEGWSGVFHPDDQALAWKRWSHSLATGEPYEVEYRLRHHSGEYRWVLGRALAVRNDAGQIIRWFGTCTDINEAKKAADYIDLLSQELSHRIKNIFAIIQSFVRLSGRRAPESQNFANDLQARIAALSRAHDLARPRSDQSRLSGGGATLHALAHEILKPYLAMDDGRIIITGQDIKVADAAATPFAMILHELATNAKKYGALSTDGGSVRIYTSCEDEVCALVWTETGGPTVLQKPAEAGFGTKLIAASAQSHLNGAIGWEWNANGLIVTVTCPCISLVRTG